MIQKVYSVGQINTYIKNMFARDALLSGLKVSGEVSNLKFHTSGHVYFTLKDKIGAISCVMFSGKRDFGIRFPMKNGDQVIVSGNVSVFPKNGVYQLYAEEIVLAGAGALYEKYLALKKELEEMGMFSPEYKQPLPTEVKTLGVVTAPTGAAVRDIISVAKRRNPGIQIILYPAKVQGEGAAQSIVRGIQMLDRKEVDLLIVGRGGGSIEDLWAFNEEIVARAVFECSTPLISAVGHETDTTIIDFVSDMRAPTPSAAAELAVNDTAAMIQSMLLKQQKLRQAMQLRISVEKLQFKNMQTRLSVLSPKQQIQEKRQWLAELEDRQRRIMQELLHNRKDTLRDYRINIQSLLQQELTRKKHLRDIYIEKLKGLSPLDKLRQGYSYTEDAKGTQVSSAAQVHPGDKLKVYVVDGHIQAKVIAADLTERKNGNE